MASPSPRRSRPAAPFRARGPVARTLITLAKLAAGAGLLLALLLAVAVAISMASLPGYRELMRSPNGQMVQVRSADGGVLVSVGPSYGEWLAFDEIPAVMVDAMIAVEDRRFYSHPGVDPIGTARALAVNLRASGSVQGGSTITQQLARNIFLTSARNYTRKVREAILALALEQRFSKREILELYLNRVYFGGGAYGIDAAARKFYGHGAQQLNLEEAAIIAGLVKAPSRYAPSSDPRKARSRAKIVIAVMADAGKITRAEANAADLDSLRFAPQPKQNNVRYFTDWVLGELEALTDETVEPLVVTTTLMSGMQQAADRAIGTNTPAGAQGALVAMSTDGAVRAMVGGRDYVTSIYNRATSSRRPGGSAFKLFVYLAALEDGVEPDDIVVDEPVTFDKWSPRNNDRTYRGEVTVRQAFALSINTVAVQLAARVGFDTVADMARRLGISTRIDRRPAMALGTSDVNLLEMTSAYASVARGGVEAAPYAIAKVTTSRGRTLYTRDAEEPRMLVAPWVAAKMTDLLKAVVDQGTGRRAAIGREVAGKTGTTSSNRDGWFLGFTGDIAAGVWMGRDDNKVVSGLAGGRAPTLAWASFMRVATRGMPSQSLQTDVMLPADGFGEPDAEVYGIYPPGEEPPLDADGEPAPRESARQPRLNDEFLDEVLAEPEPSAAADPVQ